ncbi:MULTISPECIES: hypothetical protein [unclassified Anaerobiospirillum]|uniref:hypothetical protein n=1 Tax=unclassified Anaerobiospirillum TaxID=2647410 RepID=UPI001FF12661|nr:MULTISPECIES: hypothetical protein [unclassified Anaerobiospirillum]MCK0527515.1 hypothetical protein [Anaerobiospirillum sp. NML120449]MCK0534861.1 hypothetical protein [Anaerobiospirillum sp. NML120511]MCK0540119.1 hypothetical protein [Anaerobiospirillum sp. NML02-A-032]
MMILLVPKPDSASKADRQAKNIMQPVNLGHAATQSYTFAANYKYINAFPINLPRKKRA